MAKLSGTFSNICSVPSGRRFVFTKRLLVQYRAAISSREGQIKLGIINLDFQLTHTWYGWKVVYIDVKKSWAQDTCRPLQHAICHSVEI